MTLAVNDKLERDIMYVKGVGPKRAEAFARVGVTNVYDLLSYCPRDYIDLTSVSDIRDTRVGEPNPVTIRARVVKKLPPARIRKGMTIYHIIFTDDTEDITVTLFNQEYLYAGLKDGEYYALYGRVTGNMVRREMSSPNIFAANTPDLIIPVYSLTEGLSQNIIRKAVKSAIELVTQEVEDVMPRYVCDSVRLCSQAYAWENVHFPKSMYGVQEARRRLTFDELFVYSLAIAYQRDDENMRSGYIMNRVDCDELINSLPFTLTAAQRRALDECTSGMCGTTRMNRLIQGDVGSGKTVVAAGAAWFAYKNGYQSCVMAPTEILAVQHYETFRTLLEPLGVRVGLLTGSLAPKAKSEMQKKIAHGEYDIVVGTHALFSQKAEFSRLALVITDEQHRFGVDQRAALAAKGKNPHCIVMSATPIPRTLALILYGSLSVSVIDELPGGRKPIKTYAVSGKMRTRALGFVKKQLELNHQGYIVCPAIDESENELASVEKYAHELQEGIFSDYRVGLLHGRLSSDEKAKAMSDFKNGRIDLLVATTVVEVGVDVPNATIMLVENADRFGLSQLHQLRGRVGRGEDESFCVLVTENTSPECVARLKTMSRTNDGFKIAEEDLKLRGPGDFFGTQQHGLPPFKIADLSRDMDILEMAQGLSNRIIDEDPKLERKENAVLRELVHRLLEKGTEIS